MSAAAKTPNRWTDELLDSMRQTTDPLADDAVAELFKTGETGAVNALMNHLVANDQLIPAQLPAVIQKYLERTDGLPDWADRDKITAAEDFFGRCGPLVSVSLMFASLPTAYAAAKGVQVLQLTARLETDTQRRIGETAQMIIDVMSPGGLSETGLGLRAAQKVRLMHAAVRHLILKSGHWNPDWGLPINQEDLAGTLMTFSQIVLRSLEKLGDHVEPGEADSYSHAWNVVGHVMGIRDELLPTSLADAEQLVDAVERRQFSPSPAGQEMTRALVDMLEDEVPGTIFKGMPDTMIRYLVGDQVADMLGVTSEDWTKRLIGPCGKLFGLVEGEEDRSRILGKAGECFGHAFVESMAWIYRGGKRAPFSIPPTLRQKWGVRPDPASAAKDEDDDEGWPPRHPFQHMRLRTRQRMFFPLLIASTLLFIVVAVLAAPLYTSSAPEGLLSFERGRSAAGTRQVLASWRHGDRIRAAFELGIDFTFLLALSNLLALGSVLSAGVFKSGNPRLAKAGPFIAWGQWLAGLLWAVQDGVLVSMLTGPVQSPWPEVAYWCGTVKFALLGVGLAYVVAGIALRLSGRKPVAA